MWLQRQAATANLLEAARADGHTFEILAKPVHPADLLRRIQNLLGVGPPAPTING
jgi:hypothetical protein